MRSGGTTPKRSTERRRRNKESQPDKVEQVGEVPVPALPEDMHDVAVAWYEALQKSGQSQWFEPTDWAAAVYVCHAITKNLEGGRFSAQLFGAVWGAMNDMLTTEQARRRARIEVERKMKETAKPSNVVDWKERLAK